MMASIFKPRVLGATMLAATFIGGLCTLATAAPTGGFLAVLNEQRANGDSMNTVSFFDADDPSVPLFSVYVGREPVGSNEWEEPTAITVDPSTGDVYIVAFDSASLLPINTFGVDDPQGDTQGDLDLIKIPFATIYDHWAANFQGHDVIAEGLIIPNGPTPTPTGTNNSTNLDYITYGSTAADFNSFHTNRVALPGAAQKVGQIVRGNGDSFFDFALEFIDQDTLLLLDDSIGQSSADQPLDEHTIRIVRQISETAGMATHTTVTRSDGGTNYRNGGYNGTMSQAATQSWGSFVVEPVGSDSPFLLQLDGAGHSEPESIAYYENSESGVRGVWITESDMPATGDAVAFLELDANGDAIGYRPQVGGGSPFFLTLSNDPASGEDLRGQADNIFVDEDSGDLIIVESGFGDTPQHEPGVLRVPVDYDNGSGEIQFGTWEAKDILNPMKDTGDTTLERGAWSVYDGVNDVVYFFNPGAAGETPEFEMDIYALDLNTGVTASYMNVDDSVALFLGDAFGDKAIFFNLDAPGLAGDYNGDGSVDAADYVVWRKTQINGQDGYNTWRNNFGRSSGGVGLAAAAVPEPASMMLLVTGFLASAWRHRFV